MRSPSMPRRATKASASCRAVPPGAVQSAWCEEATISPGASVPASVPVASARPDPRRTGHCPAGEGADSQSRAPSRWARAVIDPSGSEHTVSTIGPVCCRAAWSGAGAVTAIRQSCSGPARTCPSGKPVPGSSWSHPWAGSKRSGTAGTSPVASTASSSPGGCSGSAPAESCVPAGSGPRVAVASPTVHAAGTASSRSPSATAARSWPLRRQTSSSQARATARSPARASTRPGSTASGAGAESSGRVSTRVLCSPICSRREPSADRASTSSEARSRASRRPARSSWALPSARRISTGEAAGSCGCGTEVRWSCSPSGSRTATAWSSRAEVRLSTAAGTVRAAAISRASAAASSRRRGRGSRLRTAGRTSTPRPAPARGPTARRSAPISRCEPSRAQMPARASRATPTPSAVTVSGPVSSWLTGAPGSRVPLVHGFPWFTARSPRGAVVGGGALLPQGIEVTSRDRGADLVDQAHHEALVVDGAQRRGQHLLGPEQVMDVGRGVVRAGVAVAGLVDRGELAAVPGPGEVHASGAGVDGAVAGNAGGGDAVEGVGPGGDRNEQVVDLADAQQVAGPLLGQLIGHPAHDGAQVLLLQRPADAEAVEGPAVDVHGAEIAGRLPAQVLVLCALDHPPQLLVGTVGARKAQAGVLGQAADRPQPGALQRLLLVAAGVHQRGQLIEGEHDVCPQPVLDLHGDLRGEAVHVAVDEGAEGDAVVVDAREALLALGDRVVVPGGGAGRLPARELAGQDLLEAGPQAHHLEAARVGVAGAGPVQEGAQTACLVDQLVAGLEVEVVGIGQQGLRPQLGHRLGQHGFDGRFGAHRDERRGGDRSVRGGDHPGAGLGAVAAGDLETGVGPPGDGGGGGQRARLGVCGGHRIIVPRPAAPRQLV